MVVSNSSAAIETTRRESVLDSALATFARFGYRKTSMEEVALAARISRPGLYFLFASKEALFRAAVTQTLTRDLAAVETLLAGTDRPLRTRLMESFDQWAGRYVDPIAREISEVVDDNPDLLGAVAENASRRFEELLIHGIALELDLETARGVAQTLISTSIGNKHQFTARDAYLRRMRVAIDLVLPDEVARP